MQFCCLGSGSKGNSTLVRYQNTLLMIDCGFSMKHTLACMQQKQCGPEQLSAILVTHEHSDHIAGVSTLARRFGVPVFATRGTGRSNKLDKSLDITWLELDQPYQIGDIAVTPVAVPHDAKEPCQFYFHANSRKLGILTDLGSISAHVMQAFADCDALLLEANHDVDMLWAGPYPPSLKQRVAGDWGHLSNHQAASLLQAVDLQRLSTLVLGHISEQNNHPDKVKQHFESYQRHIENLLYATQEQGFDWLDVG